MLRRLQRRVDAAGRPAAVLCRVVNAPRGAMRLICLRWIADPVVVMEYGLYFGGA